MPSPDSLFVVSGGARGITAGCVIRLAQRYGCAFALLGRSSAGDPEPAWALGCSAEPELKRRIAAELRTSGEQATPPRIQRAFDVLIASREIAATLAAVERAGGRAAYFQVDVADAEAVQSALESVARQLGPVTGLIHGAGSLADRLIQDKSGADFEAVYRPKVDGLANLLRCLPPGQLRHLVLFSSAAAYYGNPGQADYAIANEVLNKAAHALKHAQPECRVLAVDWGPWEGGMVSPALREIFLQRGVRLIRPDEGAELLVRLLERPAGEAVQVVVGGPLVPVSIEREPDAAARAYRVRRCLSLADNPFLADHVIDGRAALPLAAVAAWLATSTAQLWPGYHLRRVEECQVLGGIVFDWPPAESREYILELNEAGRESDELRLAASIWSQGRSSRPRYHYRARLALGPDPLPPLLYEGFDLSAGQAIDGAALYRDGTLFHGPRFQGFRRLLNASETRLSLECALAEVERPDQGQFPVGSCNYYALDQALQGLTVWSRRFRGSASLPLRVASLEQFRPVPWRETFYVSVEIRSATDETLTADAVLHDAAGRGYVRLRGVEHTLSPRLNERFLLNRLPEPRPA